MKSINNRLSAVSKILADWNLVWYLLFFVGFSLLVWGSLGFGLDVLLRGEYVSLIRFHSVVFMLIFLLSALLLGHFLFRISIIWLLSYLSLPAGLIYSSLEFTLTLISGASFFSSISVVNILLPTFVAGLVCCFSFFLTNENVDFSIEKNATQLKLWMFLVMPGVISWPLILSEYSWTILFNMPSILIVWGCLLMALVRQGIKTDKSILYFGPVEYSASLLEGGKVTTFVGAGLVALFYISLSRTVGMEGTYGPLLATAMIAVLYGTTSYLLGIMLTSVSGKPESQRNLRLDAWHLVEAYGFIILSVFSARSVFDMV